MNSDGDRAAGPSRAGQGADKFSAIYFAWASLAFLLFLSAADLDRAFHLGRWLAPLVFTSLLAVLIGCTAALMCNVAHRRWRSVASVLAAPLAVYALFAMADAAGVNAERIRLEIGRRYYLRQIARLAPSDQPRLILFDWGESGGAGATSLIQTLVYDEADEILLPAETRSVAWRERAGRLCPGTPMCAILWRYAAKTAIVKKIDGHFYLLTEVY